MFYFTDEPIVDANQNGDNDDGVAIIDSYDTDALKKFALTQAARAKHWREKFNKAQVPVVPKPAEPLPTAKAPETVTSPEASFDTIADMHSVMRSLEDDELQSLRVEAKELGVDPVKFIKSKAGQAHLKDIRATKKSTDTTPSPSSKVVTFNGKPVNDIFRDDKASGTDKQKAFEARMRGARGANSTM